MSGGGGGVGEGSVVRRVVRPETQYKPLRAEQNEEKARLLSKMLCTLMRAAVSAPCTAGSSRWLASWTPASASASSTPSPTLSPTRLPPPTSAPTPPVPSPCTRWRTSCRTWGAGLSTASPASSSLLPLPRRLGGRPLPAPRRRRPPRRRAPRRGGPRHGQFLNRLPHIGQSLRGGADIGGADGRHPDPHRLLRLWASLSTRLPEALNKMSELQGFHRRQTIVYQFRDWLLQKSPAAAAAACGDPPPPPAVVVVDLAQSWDIAASRPGCSGSRITNTMFSYQHIRCLKMVLLNTIHGFYLRALARLPRRELRHRFHRSLPKAGSCYGPMDPEPMYQLHIICGLNEFVCGPEYCHDKDDALSVSPCKYRYTHVNFLVTRKDFLSAGKRPILFFAEFDNEEEEVAPLLCCCVDAPTPFAEHVRCLYCEAQGAKIVHPCLEKFHGGDEDFEEVIRGKRYFTNTRLICKSEFFVQRLGGNEEDFMYVNTRQIT